MTTINGIDITIDLAKGILSFVKDGQEMQLTYKSIHINGFSSIPVVYTEDFKNSSGEIFQSNERTFDAVKQMSWDYFYDAVSENKRGDDLINMCLNGMSLDYFGEYIFI